MVIKTIANAFKMDASNIFSTLGNRKNGIGTNNDVFGNISVNGGSVLTEGELSLLYRDGLIQKIIDLLPEDANLYPPILQVASDTSLMVEALHIYNNIEVLASNLEDLSISGAFEMVGKDARLYGDAFLVMGVNDNQDYDQPVDVEKIVSIDWVYPCNRYNVGLDPLRETYHVSFSGIGLQKQSLIVHKSRVLRISGKLLNTTLKNYNGGFNESVLNAIIKQFTVYFQSLDSTATMLNTHSIFKYRMKGFSQIAAKHDQSVLNNRFKSIFNGLGALGALVFDADAEDAEFIQRNFANIDNILAHLKDILATVSDIPANKLFGMGQGSAFSDSGDSDRWEWSNRVLRYQTSKLQRPQTKLFEYILKSKQLGAKKVDKWSIAYKPMYELSLKELSAIYKQNADADNIYVKSGVLSPEEVRKSRFEAEQYGNNINLESKSS